MKKHPMYLPALGQSTLVFLFLAGLFVPGQNLAAGEWPQILGPQRNGVAEDEKLQTRWPSDGPKKLWSKPIGMGYASAVVRGAHIIVFHRQGKEELLQSLTPAGETRWTARFPAYYRGGINNDLGPRCTPVIDGDEVFGYGAAGDLYCVSLADGKQRWARALAQDYRAPDGYFGAGSAPMVLKDRILVNVGGPGAGLVAVNRSDGKTIWKKTDEGGSYSAPARVTFAGKQAVLFLTRLNAVCVDPENGAELFRFRFGKTGPTVNAATPLINNNRLFLTASYGIGGDMRRLENGKVEKIWANDDALSSQYATPVFHENYLFGSHGREDIPGAEFRCLDASTGKVRWSRTYDVAHVLRAGDLLLIQTVTGKIELLKANPQKYERLASAVITEKETKPIPALANGRLYIRANAGNQSELICLQVGQSAP